MARFEEARVMVLRCREEVGFAELPTLANLWFVQRNEDERIVFSY